MEQERNDRDEANLVGRRKKSTTAYPKNTLKEALEIAYSIQNDNAGHEFNRLDLAQSLDVSPESSGLRTLITSSGRYGLTKGSYAAEKISLTELGKSIVAPRSDEEKGAALLRALMSIDLFSQVYAKYDQSKFPREELLKNSLVRDYDIPQDSVDDCLRILKQNLEDWGILVDMQGSKWVRLDKLSSTTLVQRSEPVIVEEEQKSKRAVLEEKPLEARTPESPIHRVFISHSKNRNILGQIKTILEFGQFQNRVAEEVESTSIPIPEKVFGTMRECNSAIINISADEQEKDLEGNYRVNPNVLIEVGAAFLMYNRRVILLADKRVALPSNLQGLYRCEYEGDELSFSVAMKLQQALTKFREAAN